MSDNESFHEEPRAENYPDTDIDEDFGSVEKDGDVSSEDAQHLETDVYISTQKVEKKKEKCGNKPKVKMKTLTIDGQLVYFCKICDKIFTRRKDKLNHELAHSGETMLTCTECGKEYLHESSLASHMRTHDVDPLFLCDLCPKMFAQSHHLKTHILSHSEPTNFACKTCYKEFATAHDLNHHNRSQIKQEISQFWCKMCKVYFCRTHGPECRKRIHAYCCSACNELFFTQKKLRIHMKKFAHFSQDKPDYIEPLTEEELYPHKVPESVKRSQSVKESSILKQSYQNISSKEAKRPAEDLENMVPRKKFKLSPRKIFLEDEQSSTSLQDSAPEGKHGTDSELRSPSKYRKGKPYCKKCNKSFKDSFHLDRHRAAMHEDTAMDFPSKQASPLTSFTCKICKAGFATKEDLERHGFKHSGERMHVCPMCGEEFPQASQLTRHLKTHMGDHPYHCSQCGKSFRLKIQLIQHVRLHIVQDANSCDKCPSKFNTHAELQDHTLQVHREGVKCHLCGKVFNQRARLLTHLRLQHCTTEPESSIKCLTQFGLKRSVSMQDEDRLSFTDIKTEPCGSDSESEQSFCSSFTRDSEKSDVFKFSSDESYSFKTAMAKERIRLRRRWRRNQQKLLDQVTNHQLHVKEIKAEFIGTEESLFPVVKNEFDVKEEGDEDDAQLVLDMMVELNVVQSEGANITTVYANLTHKPPTKAVSHLLPTDKDPALYGNHIAESLHKNSLNGCENAGNVVSTTPLLNFPSMLDKDNNFNREDEEKELARCDNMVMFEFDPEELGINEDDLTNLSQLVHSPDIKQQQRVLEVNSNSQSDDGKLYHSQNSSQAFSAVTGSSSISHATSSLSTVDTPSAAHSGLARLQEVFQNSSKYLPLTKSDKSGVSTHVKQSESFSLNQPLNAGAISKGQSDEDVRVLKSLEKEGKMTKNKNLHRKSQDSFKTVFTDAAGKSQDVGNSELLFMKPFANDKHNTLKSSQSQNVSQPPNLKKNCKALVNASGAEKIPLSAIVKEPKLKMTKHDLPQSNISRPVKKYSPSHSSSSSSSVAATCLHSQSSNVLNVNTSLFSLLQTTSAPSASAAISYTSTSSVPETRTTNIQQEPEFYLNQREDRQLTVPSHQPSVTSSAIAIQPSSIFDTNNPLLRDMNMMDLVRAFTPAPVLSTPQPRVIPTRLPEPDSVQTLQPHNLSMAHPVNVSVPPIPGTLPFQSPFVLSQTPGMSLPSFATLDKPNHVDLQLMQPSGITPNLSNSTNQMFGLGMQGDSGFTGQHQTSLIHQNFRNTMPVNPGLGPPFDVSLQQQQQQFVCGQPDMSSLMNLNCMLSSGSLSSGVVGGEAASVLSAQMRSLQESALKDSLYHSVAHSNGFQQNYGGMLVSGANPQLQPNIGALGSGGLNPGSFNLGAGGVAGPVNFPSLPGGPPVGFGGQIPSTPQPQMINIFNGDLASVFPGGLGFPNALGPQAMNQLSSNLLNQPLMQPGGPTSFPANLIGVLGPSDPSSFPSHFTGFPHL